MKNSNIAEKARFARIFISIFGVFIFVAIPLCLSRPLTFIAYYFMAAIAISFAGAFAATSLLGSVGGAAGGLYGGPKANWSLSESLIADLDIARRSKMNKNFKQALAQIDDILNQAPDYPDALFLKAQILWEGFKDPGKSRMCLRKVLNAVPDKDQPLNRWASSLYTEILENIRGNQPG